MAKHVRINNIEHKDLRVATQRSARFGDNVNLALLVPGELRTAQNFYPVFIQKDSNTGKFFLSALFGFQEGENLFLDESGWNAEYIPVSIVRQPFLIGQEEKLENGEKVISRVIHVDMESPRVNAEGGQRIFTDEGETTAYLDQTADMLELLHQGLIESDQLIERLLAYNLIEPMTLKVGFNEYKKYELSHLYTINEDVLAELDDDVILSLFKDGSLEKIYSIIHSQSRVSTLVKLKGEQDAS